MLKKTALYTLVLMLFMAMGVGGTLAYFSGASQAEEAVIHFGTVDIKVEVEADQEEEWLPRIRWRNEDNAKTVSWTITNEGTQPIYIRADLETQLTGKVGGISLDQLEQLLIEWVDQNQSGTWEKEPDGLWYYSHRVAPEGDVDLSFQAILTRVGGVLGGEYTIDLEVEGVQALDMGLEASWQAYLENNL